MDKVMLSVPMYVNGEDINEMPGVLLALGADNIQVMIRRVEQVQEVKRQDQDTFSLSRHAWGLAVFDRSGAADLFEDGAFGDGEGLVGETIVDLTPEQYTTIKTEVGDYSPRLKPGASRDWLPRDCSPSLKMLSAAL